MAEEGREVHREAERDDAHRPVRRVVFDQIRGRLLEGDATDVRRDRHASFDVALVRL